jgi:hydrogenase maturation protease
MAPGLAEPFVLIAGLGNLLMGDDGVGIHAVRALMVHPPRGTRVIEVGTAVLHALDEFERASAIIALDAIDAGQPPGTLTQVTGPAVATQGALRSFHDVTLADLVRTLPRKEPPPVVILGIQPAMIRPSLELSPPVLAALPRLVAAARETALSLVRVSGLRA